MTRETSIRCWAGPFSGASHIPSAGMTGRPGLFCLCRRGDYRREVFEEIGYFDERHFAYLEDLDVGYRARISDGRTCTVPTLRWSMWERYQRFQI